MKCPQCGEPHDLSDCPRWKAPVGYRLLPVALAPHIKDALFRWTDMPLAAWTDVMLAQERIDATIPAPTLKRKAALQELVDIAQEFDMGYGPAAATAPDGSREAMTDQQIDALMALAMPGTRPSACFRKFARLVAEQVICGLCNLPRTVCGCAPTDDGPGQQAAAPEVEIEKKGTEDANAK